MAAQRRLYFEGAGRVVGGPPGLSFTESTGAPVVGIWNGVEFATVTAVSNHGDLAVGLIDMTNGRLYIWRTRQPFGDLHWVPHVAIQTSHCHDVPLEACFQLWFDSRCLLHVAAIQVTMTDGNLWAVHQYLVGANDLSPETVYVANEPILPFPTQQGIFPRCVRICQEQKEWLGSANNLKDALVTILPALVEDVEHPGTYHIIKDNKYCVVRPSGEIVELQGQVDPGDLCYVLPDGGLFETGPRCRVSIDPARPLRPSAAPDSLRVTANSDGLVYLGRADGTQEQAVIIGGGRPVLSQDRALVAEYSCGLVCYASMPDALDNPNPVFGPVEQADDADETEIGHRDLIITTACASGDLRKFFDLVPSWRKREVLPVLLYVSECAKRAGVPLLDCAADVMLVCRQLPATLGEGESWQEGVMGEEPWHSWIAGLSGHAERVARATGRRLTVLKQWRG